MEKLVSVQHLEHVWHSPVIEISSSPLSSQYTSLLFVEMLAERKDQVSVTVIEMNCPHFITEGKRWNVSAYHELMTCWEEWAIVSQVSDDVIWWHLTMSIVNIGLTLCQHPDHSRTLEPFKTIERTFLFNLSKLDWVAIKYLEYIFVKVDQLQSWTRYLELDRRSYSDFPTFIFGQKQMKLASVRFDFKCSLA